MDLTLTLDQVKTLYRAEIEPNALDAWGPDWWEKVHLEIERVVAADSLAQAAVWWHHDWMSVSDTARAAARRIRVAAKRARRQPVALG
jgi:hypothetical protein